MSGLMQDLRHMNSSRAQRTIARLRRHHLLNLLIYLVKRHGREQTLDIPRLIRLCFLVDWCYAVTHGDAFTGIRWRVQHHEGLFSWEVFDLISDEGNTFAFDAANRPVLLTRARNEYLGGDAASIADGVLAYARPLNGEQLKHCIERSYPGRATAREMGTSVDLEMLSWCYWQDRLTPDSTMPAARRYLMGRSTFQRLHALKTRRALRRGSDIVRLSLPAREHLN